MQNIKIFLVLFLILFSRLSHSTIQSKHGGLDFNFYKPEMFFKDFDTLKLSVEYEIFNCYARDRNQRPINQCADMKFVVISETESDNRYFKAPLNDDSNCVSEDCYTIVKLPIVAILEPWEYKWFLNGKTVYKKLTLKLAFLGRHGKKRFAKHFYELEFILNPTGLGTSAIISFNSFFHRPTQTCNPRAGDGSAAGNYVDDVNGFAWFNLPSTNYFFGVDRATGNTKRSNGGLIYSDPNCQNLVGEVFDYPLHLSGDVYVFPFECKWYEYPLGGFFGRYPHTGTGYYLKSENKKCRFVNDFVPDLREVRESQVQGVFERYKLPLPTI